MRIMDNFGTDGHSYIPSEIRKPYHLFHTYMCRSTSRKRTASSKTEASVLKESLAAPLSPVPELSAGHNSSRDLSSVGVTPIQKKKRKLYKQTPQLSEVFIVKLSLSIQLLILLFLGVFPSDRRGERHSWRDCQEATKVKKGQKMRSLIRDLIVAIFRLHFHLPFHVSPFFVILTTF